MDGYRAAASRPEALWVQAACLALAAACAWIAADMLAVPGDDLLRARELGILSATTLAGYAKSRDMRAYAIAMSVGITVAVALWYAWCAVTKARPGGTSSPPSPPPVRGRPWVELAVLGSLLLLGLLRFDLAVNGWDAPYTFYSEEGEAIAWADVVFRGGLLSRDTYCLYGPLATYPIAAAFSVLGPSVQLWRLCVYLFDLPALLAAFLLVRELNRSRWAAWSGVALICFHRMWPMPAMSWSLLRTGLGLGAIAAAAAFLRTGRRRLLIACGAALGAAVLFSQEAGIAAAAGVAALLGADLVVRRGTIRAGVGRTLDVGAGAAAVAAPIVLWYAAHGGAGAMVANLFGFAHLRVLGHGGQPFPNLASLASWETSRETLAAYLAPVVYAVTLFRVAVRAACGDWEPRHAARLGIAVYGAILFMSPLTRPDDTHVFFALTPAFVLMVDLVFRALRTVLADGATARRSAAATCAVLAIAGIAWLPADTLENVRLFGRQAILTVTGRFHGAAPEDLRPLALPRAGGVRVPADRADEIEAAVRYVQERTGHDEPVWAFPNEPMLGFLAERPPAARYALALFAVTREQRLDLIDGVERSGVRYAIVNSKPAMVDGIASRVLIPEPWAYLDAHFVLERSFGRLVVMRRAEGEAPP